MTEIAALIVLIGVPGQEVAVDDVPGTEAHESALDHAWLGVAFGAGPQSPLAFAGVELLVQPSRYLAFGVAVGFGPSATNPDHRICLWSCDSSAIQHAGPTPWRWSASVLGTVPVGERIDVQLRLSLMRNPGAVYGFVDSSYGDDYDDYDDDYYDDDAEDESRIEYRPMALAVLGTVGLKIRLRGSIFLRVEGGWSQVVFESVPWGAAQPNVYYNDELPEVVSSRHSPLGPAFMLSLGAEFL